MIEILQTGLSTQWVGPPKFGRKNVGIGSGGPADRLSARLANLLVGNPVDTTVLEFTLLGPTLQTTEPLVAVVLGADFCINRGNQVIDGGTLFEWLPGQLLQIRQANRLLRGYLAFCSHEHGCTNIGKGIGDYDSRRWLNWPDTPTIHLLPGPQHQKHDADFFANATFTVKSTSNRMGIRLAGPAHAAAKEELISEPVCPGTMQITHDGLPLLLGMDCQTIGGYPKCGYVIDCDLDRLGQLRPDQKIQFAFIEEQAAEEKNREYQERIQQKCQELRRGLQL